MRYAAIIE